MHGLLTRLLEISVLVFAVSSMLSVGLSHTLTEVIGPLRRAHAVIRALLANFVLIPLLGFLVVNLIPISDGHEIGLFLLASAAGAPFLIKLVQAAGGDMRLCVALILLLLAGTMIYMPIAVPLVLPDADVSAVAIAMPLVLTMLIPLVFGLFLHHQRQTWAERIQPSMNLTSTIALAVLVLTTVVANWSRLAEVFFTRSLLAAVLVVGGAFVIGYLLGFDRASSVVLGLGTSQRNIAAATVVATQAVGDPDTVVMVVATSLAGFAILFPVAAWLRRRSRTERWA